MRLAITLALVVLAQGAPARANDDGRQTGRAMRGCGTAATCHGVNPGAAVRIEGPMTLTPGARATYTLVITSTRSDFMAGGFNISAAGATLAPGGMLAQLRDMELTHVAPVPRSGAEVRVPFEVTAPMAAGDAMLFAAGNAVNRLNNSSNDAWGVTALTVAVGAAAPDAGVTDAGATDAGAADVATTTDARATADTGPRTERYDPTASSGYGGCRAAPGRVGEAGWSLALLGLAARRRRSRCAG